MSTTPTAAPATDWQERVAPDEAERFAVYADQLAAIQQQRSLRYGAGRALHRKQVLAAHGELTVLDTVPPFARHGLFAKPATYPVQLRLSNGGMERASDSKPDIRGFSLRVQEVTGPCALDGSPASSQDFALINQEVFSFTSSADFVDFVVAAAQGPARLLAHLMRRYGLIGGVRRLGAMIRTMSRPFSGFATEPFYSAAPIACGPYAVRVRLLPGAGNGAPRPDARQDWGADMRQRLAHETLRYQLQLQPYVSENLTPIEDPSVNWPTPYHTVAQLSLPPQDLVGPPRQALAQQVEQSVFDPWQALAAHRPLGEVMRARKVVYFRSQQQRQAR